MQKLAAVWGVTGIVLLLSTAIFRLSQVALQAFNGEYELLWYHWLFMLVFSIFMLYSEGYKGFQKAFAPRVAARAKFLSQNANLIQTFLAPLFCMAYFHTTKKRQIVSITLTLVIIGFIMLVCLVPPLYRSMIDAGVVLGLSYGVIAVLAFVLKAFTSSEFDVSPELPEAENQS